MARLAHAGDRSPLALANRAIADLDKSERAVAGRFVGSARARVNRAVQVREQELLAERDRTVLRTEAVDVSLPTDRYPSGARHPISSVMERIGDIFVAMGWEVAEGPELESEWLNFDALNFPPDHPAREMQDSLFVAPRTSAAGGTEHLASTPPGW